jgi:prepilin-type N-terminal cleavage/methylation domain-containing protein
MKKTKGFTLLELLVVIGIIGVIMALATVAYSTTQKSGRDSRRKQDLVSMQNALEQYYAANSYVYPTTCSDASSYLKGSWPTDPSSPTYTYVTNPACTATRYCICATMEGGSGGNSGASCNFAIVGAKTHYCIGNLQ